MESFSIHSPRVLTEAELLPLFSSIAKVRVRRKSREIVYLLTIRHGLLYGNHYERKLVVRSRRNEAGSIVSAQFEPPLLMFTGHAAFIIGWLYAIILFTFVERMDGWYFGWLMAIGTIGFTIALWKFGRAAARRHEQELIEDIKEELGLLCGNSADNGSVVTI